MTNVDYDILVIGGGMVGASFACALGGTSLRVAVIESRPADTDCPLDSFDIRVSAITRASQRVFEGIGAWDGMARRRISPYREMQVWDASGDGAIHFDSADLGEPDLGHIVENRVILAALLERMAVFDNVDLLCPAQVKSLKYEGQGVNLELEDGQRLKAKLLVGADGSNSWVRQQTDIKTTQWSYGQKAVVATIKTSASHQETAWQRFLPEGPLAFLPMAENYSSIVWSTTPENADALLALDDEAFLTMLQQTFGDKLGQMESTGPRGAFPLALQHARDYVRERIALIGNAAHTIHPLAGQGLNLGVSDAAALAEVLLDAQAEGKDVGSLRVLRRYERWRKGDNIAVMAAMDGFKRLFGSRGAPLRWLRNTGLKLTNASGPVKDLIMRRALGIEGDLPRLARSQVVVSEPPLSKQSL